MVSKITFFLTLLEPNEYLIEVNKPKFGFNIDQIHSNVTNFINKEDKVEEYRPFIGDQIWSYYFIYRAICFRTIYLIEKLKNGQEFGYWYEDSGMKQLMSFILSEKEIEMIIKQGPHSLYRTLDIIEVKILKEFNYILSGKKSAIETFEDSKELRELIAQYQPEETIKAI